MSLETLKRKVIKMCDYNKISKNNKSDKIEVTEQIINDEINGIVNVDLLNVREEPVDNADVLGVVKNSTKIVVEIEESTDDFYKICTETGLEGFCMKQFIDIV